MPHEPVLLERVLEYLAPAPDAFIVDGTLDGGGHAEAILAQLGPTGRLLGVDWDAGMTARFATRHGADRRVVTATGNYADLPELLKVHKLPRADGLLVDLGFSSEQLEGSGRGFSFRADEPLLMTYSDTMTPVRDLLPSLSEDELVRILREKGGERMAGRIARAIRSAGRIMTSGALADVVRRAVPKGYERGRIDPATRTFQALRIHANRELENLEHILGALAAVVAPHGRVVILTFHSLEDGLVKRAFRAGEKAGTLRVLTPKPLPASRAEIVRNPRSRSAKLRAAELL